MTSHATGDGHIPSRDTSKRGLKRIMTVGGVYGTRNYTVKDLRDQKGKQILTETVPFSIEEAAAAEEAGIDTLKVRFDPKNPDPACQRSINVKIGPGGLLLLFFTQRFWPFQFLHPQCEIDTDQLDI